MPVKKFVAASAALLVSTASLAQSTGSLIYGPYSVPVPIPSIVLLAMSIAMAFVGYRTLRRQARQQLLGALLLTGGLSLGAISGLGVQDSIAVQSSIQLDNPQGGTVEIPIPGSGFTNSAGISLRIESVTPPPSCVTTAPSNECVAGLVLADGESCSTQYKDCADGISTLVTYTFDNVTFDDGGTLTGSFVFNPDIVQYTSLSITTSGVGNRFFQNGFTYSTAGLQNGTNARILLLKSDNGNPFPATLQIDFSPPLGSSGPVLVNLGGVEYSGAAETRSIAGGTATGIH